MAVMISLAVSLTTTPMPRAACSSARAWTRHGRLDHATEHAFDLITGLYRLTLRAALRHSPAVAFALLATIGLNYYMFRYQITYGLFPVQDTGLVMGGIVADQNISFQSMKAKFVQLLTIVRNDPGVASVVGFTGGRQTNVGFAFVSLKPYSERRLTADAVVARLRDKAQVDGVRLFMFAGSDLRTGGRQSNSAYQYTLLSDDASELSKWAPKLPPP